MNEVYVMGGALVIAGVYIMWLHHVVRVYRHGCGALHMLLQQAVALLEEDNDAEKERD